MKNSDAFASQSASVAGLTDQIVPTIPHGKFKIVQPWYPVPPALRLHLDSALVNPVNEQKIVRHVLGIRRAFAARSKVSTSCRKSNLLLRFLAELPGSLYWLHHCPIQARRSRSHTQQCLFTTESARLPLFPVTLLAYPPKARTFGHPSRPTGRTFSNPGAPQRS